MLGLPRPPRNPVPRLAVRDLRHSENIPCQVLAPADNPRPNFTNMADTAIIDSLRLNPKDTGSSDVQIALLTQRINEISDHLKSHSKDHASRRGLLMLVARRRKLLDYLKRTAADRYVAIIQKLNLRK